MKHRDAQRVRQVEEALDGVGKTTAYTMDVTWVKDETGEHVNVSSKRVGGPDPSLPLEELERNADIARARYMYAIEQRDQWNQIIQSRTKDFNDALITYYKKKHNLSDDDLEKNWEQDAFGFYEKRLKPEVEVK